MKQFIYFSALACGSLLVASCEDYDFGVTPETLAQVTYEQNFRKDFGDFDPTNDFNLAQRGEVTVTPNGNREVCIYKKAANGYQLIARYDDVTSTRTLGFDIPKGETEILVVNGSATQVTTVGGTVTFGSGTRAGNFDGTLGDLSVRLNDGEDYTYYYYDATEAVSYKTTLPEGFFNKDKAIDDFSLISTGEFIIYPTYWNAGIASRLGIYYYDNAGNIQKKVICGNHGYNESIQYKNNNGDWVTENTIYGGCNGNSYHWVGENGADKGHEALTTVGATDYRSKGIIINLPVGTKFGFYTPMFDDSPSNFAGTDFETTLASGEGGGANHHLNTNIYVPNNLLADKNGCSNLGGSEHLQSKRSFGRWWFLKNGEVVEATWTENRELLDAHSESNLNPPDAWDKNYTLWNKDVDATENNPLKYDRHAVMFGLYYDKYGDMVIGAEDCYYLSEWNASDYDLNDKIFKIYGSQPLLLNNKAQSWHLAFEDLGGSFDWDFNDVVLQIDYVSGQNKAHVTPIAAGGTLHSHVYFNDTDNDAQKQSLGEIHEWLGATPVAADVLYEPINADSRGVPGVRKEVNVTSSFTISNAMNLANGSSNGTSSKNILGLYIETAGNEDGKTNTIAYAGMGKAPAMLVLPTSYKSGDKYLEWAWPTERFDISEAYKEDGHKFTDWVNNHNDAQDWYKYPSKGTVEAKVAGKYANGATTAGKEYEKADYGTTISFPNKTDNLYVFDVNNTFGSDATSVTITVALKGIVGNQLVAYDGTTTTSEALGTWKRTSSGGTFTTIGDGHNSGTTNVNIEGLYRIELSEADLTAIKTAGHWAITAGEKSEIIYIAFK